MRTKRKKENKRSKTIMMVVVGTIVATILLATAIAVVGYIVDCDGRPLMLVQGQLICLNPPNYTIEARVENNIVIGTILLFFVLVLGYNPSSLKPKRKGG